jgi:serine/threonine protein kinase
LSSKGSYNSKAEVWAIGMILHELVFWDLPFKSEEDILYKDFELLADTDKVVGLLVTMALNKDVEERASIQEILRLLKTYKIAVIRTKPITEA